MPKKIIIRVLLVLVLLAGATYLILVPTGDRPRHGAETLPWSVTVNPDGSTTAFGFTLGRTTLAEVRARLQDQGKLSLFSTDAGRLDLEAFFQEVSLHGLKAKMVVVLTAPREQLEGMYGRGTRISTLAEGQRRVTLHPDDIAAAAALPVSHITYLPSARLDEEIIDKRFGAAAEKRLDSSGVTHWLYPSRGIDVAVAGDGKTVIQYTLPEDFTQLTAPLHAVSE
jgi:hypothetical protein